MECREAQKLLREGRSSPALAAHLAACPACAEAAALAGPLAAASEMPLPDLGVLEADVARLVRAERGPLAAARALPRVVRFAFLAAAGVLAVAFLYSFLRRLDFSVYPSGRYLAIAGSYALVGVVALWQALRPLHRPPAPAWLVTGLVTAGVLLPVVVALLPELPTLGKGLQLDTAHQHVGWSFYCWAVGGATGLLVLVLAFLVARDGLRELDRALFAGLAAGMVGLASVHMECPINYPLHLLVGHAAVPLLFLAATWVRRVSA